MAVVMLDVDGCLADFVLGFTKLAGYPERSCVSQGAWEDYGGVEPADVAKTWLRIKESASFWRELPALVNAKTFDEILYMSDEHAVYYVTNRIGRHVKWQTESWLRTYGDINYPTVLISSRKGDTARALGADYALDDKAGNAVYTAYASPETKSYLLDRPYNRFDADVLGSRVRRVASVEEFLHDVEKGA